jgi:hypothetical protein
MTKKTDDLERQNLDAYFRSTKAPGPLETMVDREVAYTRYFLKQIGVPATDPMWRQRGIVKEVRDDRFALVQWNDGEEPRLVATSNLAHPGPNLRFCE